MRRTQGVGVVVVVLLVMGSTEAYAQRPTITLGPDPSGFQCTSGYFMGGCRTWEPLVGDGVTATISVHGDRTGTDCGSMPVMRWGSWQHVTEAAAYGGGGVAPMAFAAVSGSSSTTSPLGCEVSFDGASSEVDWPFMLRKRDPSVPDIPLDTMVPIVVRYRGEARALGLTSPSGSCPAPCMPPSIRSRIAIRVHYTVGPRTGELFRDDCTAAGGTCAISGAVSVTPNALEARNLWVYTSAAAGGGTPVTVPHPMPGSGFTFHESGMLESQAVIDPDVYIDPTSALAADWEMVGAAATTGSEWEVLTTPAFDFDGDGFDRTVDCRDLDAAIFPGASEICDDAEDNDCDGWADADDGECGVCPDGDADLVCDMFDNCPMAANADQVDTDDDGLGDACDPDAPGPDAGVPDAGVPTPDAGAGGGDAGATDAGSAAADGGAGPGDAPGSDDGCGCRLGTVSSRADVLPGCLCLLVLSWLCARRRQR